MNRVALQRGLLAPVFRQRNHLQKPMGIRSRAASSVTQSSFWRELIPKPLRSPTHGAGLKKAKPAKGWNPATFFIIIFLFIGSMSIQMIALKRDFATFMRRSDVRIGLLREVVEKLQKGEEVDVEKVLGTGNPEKELEWEEVLKEIERGEAAPKQRKKQPEPPHAPSPEAVVPPAQEPTRAQAQSTLATKGFF
ncbi:hypothetical protein MFIFM68171_10929 [Madurella fahalii]|uniref:Cell division protein n=1 Tax=Madurella fahalii TaxID=1157608 RepID=A0ABQ0GSL3_9PEZI